MKKYQRPNVRIIDLEAEQMIAGSQIDEPSVNVPDMGWGNTNQKKPHGIWNRTEELNGKGMWK